MRRYPVPALAPSSPHESETFARRSRFLAQSARIASAAEARAFVAQVRARHPGATHNCWAFVAGPPGDTARIGSSDDGEPHGTAGRPMLQVLLHGGLGEICTVVTRWFGGVKLGTGGLVRAYQEAVRANLASLPRLETTPRLGASLVLGYAHLDAVKRALLAQEAIIEREDYGERARLTLSVPQDRLEEMARAVSALSNGEGRLTRLDAWAFANGPGTARGE